MINSFREEYFFLSNFYAAPVEYKGVTYQNNEAAFQAQKVSAAYQIDKGERPFTDERIQFSSINPAEAKKLGRKVSLRPDWEDVKIQAMREIVEAKFDQNPELAEKLIGTGDEYLEEGNTWGDRIWGTVDGKGSNLLGQILMETREKLKEKEIAKDDM